ncbi:MAG: NAD(P)-dependent oxidoreductase, partial [Promethearchaeota archaeon]
GKTLGIVGLGRIGASIARRATGFNMKVLYYDITRRMDIEAEFGLEFVDFKRILKESDFVTIHTPLTERTRRLFGEREFKAMKRTAYLVNAARGPIVDEAALAKALQEGWIAGAALDVFEEEPISQKSPLLKLANVVLVPHIGSASVETRTRMAIMVAENLLKFFRGKTPPNLVNPEVLNFRSPQKLLRES